MQDVPRRTAVHEPSATRWIGIHPMKGLPKHDEVETSLRGVPILERAHLDGDALPFAISAIRGSGSTARTLTPLQAVARKRSRYPRQHRARFERHATEGHRSTVGIARPTRIVESRRGTK